MLHEIELVIDSEARRSPARWQTCRVHSQQVFVLYVMFPHPNSGGRSFSWSTGAADSGWDLMFSPVQNDLSILLIKDKAPYLKPCSETAELAVPLVFPDLTFHSTLSLRTIHDYKYPLS